MESVFVAIISGVFSIVVVYLKDSLDTKRLAKRDNGANSTQSSISNDVSQNQSSVVIEKRLPQNDALQANAKVKGSQGRAILTSSRNLESLIIGLLVIILVSVAAAYYNVASIIISGPAGIILGLIIFYKAVVNKNIFGSILGISAPIISGIITFLIISNKWGISESQEPISYLLVFYGIFAIIVTVLFFSNKNRKTV